MVDNQVVHQGELLASIDERDYQNAVDAAKARIATQDATIARIGQQIDAQGAAIAQAEAQVAATKAQLTGAKADVERAALEYDRSLKLAQTNFGSQQRLEQATADRDRTAAAVAAANASAAAAAAAVEGAKANLDVLKAQQDEATRQRGELATALAKAELDMSFTRVLAPFDGVVGNKAAEVGELVQPGTRLMALVPLNASYVDANFKETQLADIRPGPEGRRRHRRARRKSRPGRGVVDFAGVGVAVLAAAAGQRDRQFHQGRPAGRGARDLPARRC